MNEGARCDLITLVSSLATERTDEDLYNDVIVTRQKQRIQSHITSIEGFVGHIGEDDFFANVAEEKVKAICEAIIEQFDSSILSFYNESHFTGLPINVKGCQGEDVLYRVISLFVAVTSNRYLQYETFEQVSESLVRIKHLCKKQQGGCYIIEELQTTAINEI